MCVAITAGYDGRCLQEVESAAEISSPLSGDSSPSSTAALGLASGGGHVDKQLDHVLRLFDTSMKQFQQVDQLATLRTCKVTQSAVCFRVFITKMH